MARIDQQIKFIGMDDSIEIWGNDGQQAFMQPEEFGKALEELMAEPGRDSTTTNSNPQK